ncbi:immunoglobulin superfamily member 6-like [Salarias fasciatus]|uniref:immunoglobulin superfamily member 6-like n=1 Tax=Salarias fasciatus TaxID=181472 RepID=UPI001176CE67|nr:immunoglobulin superfamily member 6-like [Salarias fasciatus]XP_029946459.1 immunoglobulin superfamily member 6-like [Salarias fasciatus]
MLSDHIIQSLDHSQTFRPAVDMGRLLWLSLLLTHLRVTDCASKKGECIHQPNREIWKKIGASVDLQCTVHCRAQKTQYEWFVFKENTHLRLSLPNDKYSLKGAALHIKSLHGNDSGIYHCAAFSSGGPGCCEHHVGPGETLIVSDKSATMVRYILLLLLFALLALYSLAVLTLIIKKYGCGTKECRKTEKSQKKKSSKKTQFRDVLQEMYRRGNLQKTKAAASGDEFQAEAAPNELDGSGEEIYQNI